MDANKELRIFEKLCTFKHGRNTNVKKGILNNRDAGAFLFWHIGPMKVREVMDLLRQWRGDVVHYAGGMTKLCFTYMFNDSYSGNYGCVGSSAMCPGIWMYHSGGKVTDPTQHGKKGMNFRRTYWYRIAKGHYAPTVECAKRMKELNLDSEIE